MTALPQALLALSVAAGGALPSPAAATGDQAVTIYSTLRPGAVDPDLYRPVSGRQMGAQLPGYAMVRHDRPYRFQRGQQALRVQDVAALIDPTTVSFSSLDEPGTRVIEQSFQFDLVSQDKLLQKYIGQPITVEQALGDSVTLLDGILLSASDGLTLQLEDGSVRALRSYSNIRFPDLPGGLLTRPTLLWQLDSPSAGEQQTRLSYETGGMTWWADYNLLLDESDHCRVDLGAWVSIINQSGASYDQARLKLVAGEPNRAAHARPTRRYMPEAMAMDAAPAGFEEKAFFEYHLYTLPRPTDLPQHATKQLELFPAVRAIACEKDYVFTAHQGRGISREPQLDQSFGARTSAGVQVFVRFENSQAQGLGIPLPAGRVRVNQLDTADGAVEFIGEDVIQHTPRNETVQLKLGKAFDLVGERKQVDFRIDTRSRQLWETFELTLRNQKSDPVQITVRETLYRMANAELEKSSHQPVREDSNQVRFSVPVGAEDEATLRYTVHYRW